MMKTFKLFIVIGLAGCSPARLQSSQIIPSDNGLTRYQLTGFTDLGDTTPNSSVGYAEYSLSDACPDGINIVSVQESPARNGLGEFLSWRIVADCY